MSSTSAAQKFEPARANEYQAQSRIALAGYDACHELAACMLSATLGVDSSAHVLIVGAGGGAQGNRHGKQAAAGSALYGSRSIAADDGHRRSAAGPEGSGIDAATLFGVLHHQPGDEAKRRLLNSIASRLTPGAPLILAGNRYAYAGQPLLLAAWGERWRMRGATADEVQAKLGKILEGADPPASEDAVAELLAGTGFEQPIWFFSSLFWGACLAKRRIDAASGTEACGSGRL